MCCGWLEMEKELISFIIPVYNVQNYLERCLNSVINQTYSNLEIILVDDGSSDSSGRICDEFSKRDSRIHVIHIPNGGVSNARNVGLEKITGDWFTFVDADDWIELDYTEILYRNAIENECSVSGGRYEINSTNKTKKKKESNKLVILNSSEECIHNFICTGISLDGMSHHKLYSSKYYRDIRFDTSLKIYEDCMYVYNLLKLCNKACVIDKVLYHWFYRADSACNSKPEKSDLRFSNVFLTLLERTDNLNDDEMKNQLKKNYLISASNVLFYAKVKRKDPEVVDALARLKQFSKYCWKSLDLMQRIKTVFVLYFPLLLPIFRRLN